MDDRRIADYFVVAGLPELESDRVEEDSTGSLKQSNESAPITDLAVIFPTLGETIPPGFNVINSTPTGSYFSYLDFEINVVFDSSELKFKLRIHS